MLRAPAVPPMGPGAMPLTRMPKAPHSSARLRVRLSTAALAADACAWRRDAVRLGANACLVARTTMLNKVTTNTCLQAARLSRRVQVRRVQDNEFVDASHLQGLVTSDVTA